MTSYQEADKSRKDYHEWLKVRVNWVKNSAKLSDKNIFVLIEALMTEVDAINKDLSDRTKAFSDSINSLYGFVETISNTISAIAPKIKQIEPIQREIRQLREEQKDLRLMKLRFDLHVKRKAEEMQKGLEQQKERVKKDLPGVG